MPTCGRSSWVCPSHLLAAGPLSVGRAQAAARRQARAVPDRRARQRALSRERLLCISCGGFGFRLQVRPWGSLHRASPVGAGVGASSPVQARRLLAALSGNLMVTLMYESIVGGESGKMKHLLKSKSKIKRKCQREQKRLQRNVGVLCLEKKYKTYYIHKNVIRGSGIGIFSYGIQRIYRCRN